MKKLCIGAMAALLAWSGAVPAETSGTCDRPLQLPLRARGELTIQSRSAALEIVGTEQSAIHVSCSVTPASAGDQIELHYTGDDESGRLVIEGRPTHTDNLKVRVEVPHRTTLLVHVPAGQVTVEKVAGDKEIDVYAGQIVISSGNPADYRSVDASVIIGEVKASAYGVDKGGFFRSFTRQISGGEYRLRAHVLTGQIDLE